MVLAVCTARPDRLAGQSFTVGPQLVFGDYREVTADLHYRGGGGGIAASFAFKKLAIEGSVAKLKYKPTGDATATVEFDATQVDVRIRYYVAGPVSAELGIVNRKAEPEFEAQSTGALRGGVRAAYLLGPGVHMGVRGGMLFGAKFSGGGSASAIGALELGLGATIDGMRGKLRITGDYEFQRIARKTGSGAGEVDVPIQQSLGRVGVAIAF
jgi:hypothetical protein